MGPAGIKNAGLPFPVGYEGGVQAVQGHTAEQQQIIAMLKFIDIFVCRLFGVDPRFVYAELDSSAKVRAKSNLPEEYTAFLNNGFRSTLSRDSGGTDSEAVDGTGRGSADSTRTS